MTPIPNLKQEAARAALAHVEDGMKLGIGTGSTAEEFVRLLAQRVEAGLRVTGVSTSERTEALCRALGVPTSSLDETPALDLTVDGADEIGPGLALIKGGGGALLREKIVAHASARMIVIADASKVVETLGAFPLPIEVNRFGLSATRRAVERAAGQLALSGVVTLRGGDSQPFVTDGGHLILDASFGRIPDPERTHAMLCAVPGVVETGLFIGLCHLAMVASPVGIKVMSR
ncbi:MAG: ribose-5-phosphate isomerase RpiA [Rhizobiaceae bacterium]|nr:ribose-5-phosphate isomerase RpiA [Rhizobiaceae bacterium]